MGLSHAVVTHILLGVTNKLRTFIENLIAEKYRNYPAELSELWQHISHKLKYFIIPLWYLKVHSLCLSLVSVKQKNMFPSRPCFLDSSLQNDLII
jgi:hypothetical protein